MAKNPVAVYLEKNGVEYTLVEHPAAYTAQEAAASADVSGRQYAKSVIVNVDGEMKMAVLAAADKVDFDVLRESLGANEVTLAGEDDFKDLFPDCELGAMPPFGNLYDIDVILDSSLTEEMTIAFCAGSHTQLIRMSSADFQRLAQPQVADFALKG